MSLEIDALQTETLSETESRIDEVIALYRQSVNPGLARLMQFAGFADLEESGEDCEVITATGKRYLDFVGGFGVFSFGHRHPKIVAAAHQQLDRLPLSTKTFFNEPMARLAARLSEIAPGDLQYSFFSNSGAEAMEAALKFARIATGRTDFVSTEGAYHGKTMGALAVTGREKYRKPFAPMVPGATFVPYNDLEAMTNAVTEKTAAIVIEPVQGEGGIHVAKAGYLEGLRRLCDATGALLVVDEVQSGLGRTGKRFGVDHAGVSPDIMALAKALGGGVMPLGATLATPAVWERIFGENPLLHTSTFGGNPLACAAGLAALEVLESEGLAQNAMERGEHLLAGLRAIQKKRPEVLIEARGVGLMIGVEFASQDCAEVTINVLAGEGIIVAYTLNNPTVIRIEPPLTITEEVCDRFLAAFDTATETAAALLEDLEA